MEEDIAFIKDAISFIKEANTVLTPDGKEAVKDEPKKVPLRPRSTNYGCYARRREAQAWRDLVEEAFPSGRQSKN